MTVIIDINRDCATVSIPDDALFQHWADITVQELSRIGSGPGSDKPVSLSLRIVDAAESASLNQTYRQKPYATNVLSFGSDLPAAVLAELDEIPLGDLVICGPVVADEAVLQGKTDLAHWAHMLVHGILHLNGYDHIDHNEAEIMEELEISILARLDFANPYIEQQLTKQQFTEPKSTEQQSGDECRHD